MHYLYMTMYMAQLQHVAGNAGTGALEIIRAHVALVICAHSVHASLSDGCSRSI